MSNKIAELRQAMIEVYGLKCWLNELWIPTEKNFMTLHHLVEVRNGGKTRWDNAALLSRSRHNYLNHLDIYHHDIYKELNCAFYDLNRTYSPPTEEYYEEIKHILRKVK